MEKNQKHEQEMLEQMLKYASAQSLEALYDEYADETADDSQPSEQLDNAVMQMLADAREKEQQEERARNKAVRYRHMLRRLAAAVALVVAIGAVGGMLVMNVEAWRVPFLNFVFEITGEGTEVRLNGEDELAKQTVSFSVPVPEYLPENFELTNSMDDTVKSYLTYQDDAGNEIIYIFTSSDETMWTKYADQEKENVSINGMNGYLIGGSGQEGITLIWGSEDEVFTLWGEISADELIKIAESIK